MWALPPLESSKAGPPQLCASDGAASSSDAPCERGGALALVGCRVAVHHATFADGAKVEWCVSADDGETWKPLAPQPAACSADDDTPVTTDVTALLVGGGAPRPFEELLLRADMSGGHNIATQLCRMNRSRLESFPLQLHLDLLPLALAAAVHAEVAAGSPRVVAARALAAAPAEARAKASATLLKVFGNVAKEPSEAKYRQLKLSNAAVAAKVVAVDGAVAFTRGGLGRRGGRRADPHAPRRRRRPTASPKRCDCWSSLPPAAPRSRHPPRRPPGRVRRRRRRSR